MTLIAAAAFRDAMQLELVGVWGTCMLEETAQVAAAVLKGGEGHSSGPIWPWDTPKTAELMFLAPTHSNASINRWVFADELTLTWQGRPVLATP